MFLTRECDYAIRIVRALTDMEIKSAKVICENEHISTSFGYKILKRLETAGIVTSYRGVSGGYQLAKAPESITIYEVISAIDKNLVLSECLSPGHECSRNHDGECLVQKELKKIQDLVSNALNGTKMTELV